MPPSAGELPSEPAISVADVGPRLRIGKFGAFDGRRVLTDLADVPNPGGPLKGDWRRTWSQAPLGAPAASAGDYAAITGSEIAPPLGAVLVTDLAAAERRRLVSAMRGQGFLTGDSVAQLATDFLRRNDPNELAERIRKSRAALILIAFAGPQGAAATELAAQTVRHLYCEAEPKPRPAVVLLGDAVATAGARRILEPEITVVIMDPDAAHPDNLNVLHQHFASAYLAANAPVMNRNLPPKLVDRPLIPITAALRRATWRLSHLMGLRLAVAHVEPRGVTLALADQGSVRIANFGHVAGENRGGHFGLQLPVEEVARWLPVRLPDADIRAGLLDRAGRPWGVPSTHRERLIQDAAIVAALSRARTQLRLAEFECDLVVGSGAMLGGDCAPLEAAACLLNGLLPVRFCQLAQDQASALPMLGCLDLLGETVDPSDALAPLAMSVAATGSARPNEPALHVAAQRNDGSSVEEVVPFGATLRLAALAGQPARIGAMPAGGLDVGGGPGRAVGLSPSVDLGVGGLLVDARGRPPAEGADPDERSELVLAWLQGLAVYGADSPAVLGVPD
ncbi:MAG: hypothetical protein OXP37_08970 [Chloroflexota bacterium]|nr:hypothetical protein [Chloroflexota bacterium]